MPKLLLVLCVTDQLEAQLRLVSRYKEFITVGSVEEVCVPLAVQPGDQYHRADGTQLSGCAMTALWSQASELSTEPSHISRASLHSPSSITHVLSANVFLYVLTLDII